MTAERRMDRLARRNDFKLYTLETPLGTSTLNSRQSATIAALAGATEVIILSGTASNSLTEKHFINHPDIEGLDNFMHYFYVRPSSAGYAYSYDVQWLPDTNEVTIRYVYKGESMTGYPRIYAVMYR